jgi:pilus assembly protein CpaC
MLSCRSGGTARFVSGGEVPIPVVDGLGSTDVQYKEYGVILEVRPKADAGGGIYAEIEAELSQIDDSVRVQNLPGFIKRRSSTAVNVRDGETIVIAGLLARERGVSKQSIPGLGRLPALGRLFSSQHKLSRQTELLVLITPHLLTADSLQQVP